jgi:hypothetical protein
VRGERADGAASWKATTDIVGWKFKGAVPLHVALVLVCVGSGKCLTTLNYIVFSVFL